jgi:hypothetical protein
VLADLVAPRLPSRIREEGVVFTALVSAGAMALLAFDLFKLVVLAAFAVTAGAATEFGRLAFQSLMQRSAPEGAQGRVFARYEVLFRLAWVAGAFLPAVVPIGFRLGILVLAGFYLAFGVWLVGRRRVPRRVRAPSEEPT